MKTEKMKFAEQQPTVQFCHGGKRALVLTGEREVTTVASEPMGEMGKMDGVDRTEWEYGALWLDVAAPTMAAVVAAAKTAVLGEIGAYDKSAAVNSFVLGGSAAWLEKDTRMGLRQNIKDKVALGEKNITMWMGSRAITLPCDVAEGIMCKLEDYAYECYNVTAAHRKAVGELTELEEILAYDYTRGYPEKVMVEL